MSIVHDDIVSQAPNWINSTNAVIIQQGAEAIIYQGVFLSRDTIIKERFKKIYRHPTLDERINARRLKDETKIMARARQSNIVVPTLYFVDKSKRLIFMENIEGVTLKAYLKYWELKVQSSSASLQFGDNSTTTFGYDNQLIAQMISLQISTDMIAEKIGQVLARLHQASIIHGDLTTSNIMIRKENMDIVLIDFGLSSTSNLVEDRAVDLYVLERAFHSIHSELTNLFDKIISSYVKYGMNDVLKRLDLVRQRGRKKIALGCGITLSTNTNHNINELII